MDTLVGPLQEKMEEWKKTVVLLDKDHAKGKFYWSLQTFPEGLCKVKKN